jgi:hypothetical protein
MRVSGGPVCRKALIKLILSVGAKYTINMVRKGIFAASRLEVTEWILKP